MKEQLSVNKHIHRASPSHDEGAWCSMSAPDDPACGQFFPMSHFTEGDTKRYLTDGRGVPVVCYECRPVQGDVRVYPPIVVRLPHEHVAFYDRTQLSDGSNTHG